MYSGAGFILGYIRYGDHDAVLHLYLEDLGYQSLFLRGIYAKKNKKKPLLSPLHKVQVVIKQPLEEHHMNVISQIQSMEKSHDEDVRKTSLRFFLADFLNKILKKEPYQMGIFALISETSQRITEGDMRSHIYLLFTLLPFLGISPMKADGLFFNPEKGTFSSQLCHPIFTEDLSKIWKEVITDTSNIPKIEQATKNEILDSLLVYYAFHSPGFRSGETLEILRELF